MVTSAELVASLHERGVQIWLEDAQLRVRAPPGVVRRHETELLRARRREIIEHLVAAQALAQLPIERAVERDLAPLTATQRLPWYRSSAAAPRRRTSSFALRVHGNLKSEALRQSVKILMERHEVLRTRVATVGDTIVQRIESSGSQQVVVSTVRTSSCAHAEILVRERMEAFINSQTDFAVDPLFAVCILALADDDHFVAVSIDQLIGDGFSLELLKRELWRIYAEVVSGTVADTSRPLLHFADYARWQERAYPLWREVHAPYWKGRLSDIPRLEWPAASEGASEGLRHYITREMVFGSSQLADLLAFARCERVLPALVVLTAFLATTSTWCRQTDLTVAVVDAGRYRAELIDMLGCLVQHLHLRIQVSGDVTLADVMSVARREFVSAAQHRDFDWVASLIPGLAVDLLFNWAPAAGTGVSSDALQVCEDRLDLDIVPLRIDESEIAEINRHIPYKLILFCQQSDARVQVYLSGDSGCFTVDSLTKFAACLQCCLATLLQKPQSALRALDLSGR